MIILVECERKGVYIQWLQHEEKVKWLALHFDRHDITPRRLSVFMKEAECAPKISMI